MPGEWVIYTKFYWWCPKGDLEGVASEYGGDALPGNVGNHPLVCTASQSRRPQSAFSSPPGPQIWDNIKVRHLTEIVWSCVLNSTEWRYFGIIFYCERLYVLTSVCCFKSGDTNNRETVDTDLVFALRFAHRMTQSRSLVLGLVASPEEKYPSCLIWFFTVP